MNDVAGIDVSKEKSIIVEVSFTIPINHNKIEGW